MKKLYAITIALFLMSTALYGQFNLQLGYGIAYGNPSDLNRLIYVYNNVQGDNLTKKMPKVHFLHGYTIGVSIGSDFKFEIHRTSRRGNVMAEATVNGVDYIRQLQIISNTLNFGASFAPSPKWDFGASLDIGNFKGFGRTGPAADKLKYERLFVLDNSLIMRTRFGFTVFAQRNFGRLSARLYWQWMPFTKSLDGLDSWLLNGQQIIENHHLEDKMSNLGLEVFFRIGKLYK
jgi:hypothetical protein